MEDTLTAVLQSLFAVMAGGFGVFKSLVFVKEGERGGLLRFGRFLRVVEPGFVFVIPFVHELRRVHVRQATLSLPTQTITLKDNLSYGVQAVVLFRVTEVYRALFEMADLYASIKDIGGTVLRERLSALKSEDLHDLKRISDGLLADLSLATSTWGIEVLGFRLADVAPTNETAKVLIQPELARAQVLANEILVNGIAALSDELGGLKNIPRSTVAALILRGSGVPNVSVGEAE